MYNFCIQNGWSVDDFLQGGMGLIATNVDVLLELPAGKEAFGVVGQVNKAPKRGGQSSKQPKDYSVDYQGQKAKFAGFGQKLFENGNGSK